MEIKEVNSLSVGRTSSSMFEGHDSKAVVLSRKEADAMNVEPATIRDPENKVVARVEASVINDRCCLALHITEGESAHKWHDTLEPLCHGTLRLQLDNFLRFIEQKDSRSITHCLADYLTVRSNGQLRLVYNADAVAITRQTQTSLRMQRPYTVSFHDVAAHIQQHLRS